MNDNQTIANTVDSSLMRFKNNVFTAELSDFGPTFRFDVDANGIPSFYIVSAGTGKPAKFFFIVDSRNGENEVQSWTFRCAEAGLKHLTAVVYND